MIEDKVLGIPFFKFDLPDKDKVEDIYNVMQTLPFIPNDTNEIWAGGSDLYKNPDLRYLFDWMQDCMVFTAWAYLTRWYVYLPGQTKISSDWFYNHTHPN